MTYKEQYYKIIQYRQAHPLADDVFGEKHHIYPKSLFPQFEHSEWNIVKLTPQEHYDCHELLVKWFEEEDDKNAYEKMVYAWNQISHTRKGIAINAEQYAELREKFIEVVRTSEKRKEAARQNLKKATAAARKSEKQKEAAMQNVQKAQEARRKPFIIDDIRFESQRDAAKHFGVGQMTICRWLNGKRKTDHQCKYI